MNFRIFSNQLIIWHSITGPNPDSRYTLIAQWSDQEEVAERQRHQQRHRDTLITVLYNDMPITVLFF